MPDNPLPPIPFNMATLDSHPPNLANIPLVTASPPTIALTKKWIPII